MQFSISRCVRIVIALNIVLFMGQNALAQFGASLQGTVEDAGGNVVSGASVTITNNNTQQTQTKTTGDTGYYRFSELPPGSYNIIVDAPNFKKATFTNISIVAESPRNLDAKLAAGGAAETVTVNAADTIALQTADASVGTSIDNVQLERVPTYGRDPYELIRTAPGITGDGARGGNGNAVFLPNSVGPGGSNFGIAQQENTVQISANGQRITDNNYMIDGVSVNSLGFGGATVVTPNIEAVGQINILSTSYSAEDGRNTGAQIRVVTKSGTNNFHGGAIFQYDEPGLNAFNKYGGPSGQPPVRVSTKNRNVAASIGGPILKDKLFFFASSEIFSLTNKSFSNAFVETQQFRDFIHTNRAGSIADLIVNRPGGVPRIRTVLDQSCTTPIDFGSVCQVVNGGLDIGSPFGARGTYVPFNGPNPKNNYIANGNGLDGIPDIQYVQLVEPSRARGRQFNGRIDFNLTPRDLIAGSAYVTKLDNDTAGASNSRQNADIPFKPLNMAGTFIYIHTFGPSLLNEFRGNATRFSENGIKDASGGPNFGIPFINVQNQAFNSLNDIQFGVPFGTTTPAIFGENQYEIRDTVTKSFGAHTIKVGFEARLEQNNNNLLGGSRPVYAFAGIWNFTNDTPIFEGINADPATGGPARANRYLQDHYYGAFVQHDWKARPNLTLNMGLRWEYFEPIYNKGFNINYPLLGTTPGRELIDATLPLRNHLWNSEYRDFSPKVGFAYSPYGTDGRVVVRGGFAVAYNRLDDVLFDPAIEDGPGIFSYGICCGTAASDFGSPFVGGQLVYGLGANNRADSYAPNPALKTPIGPNGLPTNGISIEVYGAKAKLPTPYSYLYSLEVQNDLGHQIVFTIGYQGSNGRHYARLINNDFIFNNFLPTTGPAKETNPFLNGAYIATDDSNQYYNALNAHVVKRFTNGFSLDGTYTFSKSIDQISNGDGADARGNQTNPADNRTERGPSDFDTRNRIVAVATYDLPKYHGGLQALKPLLNGWQVNGIFTAHTGFPYTPVTFDLHGIPTSATSFTIGPVRPLGYTGTYNPTCGNRAFEDGTTVRSGDFITTAPPGSSGTNPGIGRNSFRGPCYQSIDASVAKEFALPFLGEGSYIRFQAQAFNVFNHLNLSPFVNGGPYTSTLIGSGTFGKADSADAGRVLELNARFRF